jgi:uncharacterized protein (DUF58 family)
MKGVRWFIAFTFLPIVLAILTGPIGISYLSLLPASLLSFSLLFEAPTGFKVEREVDKTSLSVGEEVTVRVRLTVERGAGLVLIGDVLPPSLELIEGSNRHVFFKSPGERLEAEYTYRLRTIKRGRHVLSPVEVEGRHFFDVEKPTYAVLSESVEITVSPKVMRIRRAFLRKRGKTGIPPIVRATPGLSSTDFRELRDYVPGDPVRIINWKATARLNRALVNEYEREGQLTVMFYLDASESMAIGGFRGSALEVAVSFVIPTVSHLLKSGYRVGLYVVGWDVLVTPVSGSSSLSTFMRVLRNVGINPSSESLPLAVERSKRILKGAVLPVVVTNLTDHNFFGTLEGLRLLSRITGRTPLLVDVDVYGAFEGGELASLKKKFFMEQVRFPVLKLTGNNVGEILRFLEVIP